jgi:multiple sugar transport system substrate-binding protein
VNVRSASVDGSEGFAINRFSNNKDAALEWLKFVVSPPVQKRVALVDGWLPVSKTILSEPALQASNPVFATYGKESHYQVKRFGSPWYSPIATNISANVVGAMLKKMSPKAALDASASYASSVIAQYRPQ